MKQPGSVPSATCPSANARPRSTPLRYAVILFLLSPASAQNSKAHFVGSESCKTCHADAYNGWKQTRMANVIRNPRLHPEAVLAEFLHPDRSVPFPSRR